MAFCVSKGIWHFWVNDQSPEQDLLPESKEKQQQPPYGRETEQLKASSANEMEGEAIFYYCHIVSRNKAHHQK